MWNTTTTADRYISDAYYQDHPDFHAADSAWKARQVHGILNLGDGWLLPSTVAEVGCGAGGVLASLCDLMPETTLHGFDVSPLAISEAKAQHKDPRLNYAVVGERGVPEDSFFDMILAIDVIEHVENPIGFLRDLKAHCRHLVAHIPLAISVQNALRPHTLLRSRQTVGHIHYFTEALAVATVSDAGYWIIRSKITPSGLANAKGVRAKLARIPRGLIYGLSPSRAAWLLGGCSVMILAQTTKSSGRWFT